MSSHSNAQRNVVSELEILSSITRSLGQFGAPADDGSGGSESVRPLGEIWIGDDTAVLAPGLGDMECEVLFASDALVNKVHFDLSFCRPGDVGFKAVMVNASDMAAMGGRPYRMVVAVGGGNEEIIDGLYAGIGEAASLCGCPVVGGDLTQSETLFVSIAMVGTVPRGQAVKRSGAKVGDFIYVTGPLGGSALGLRHLRLAANRSKSEGGKPEVVVSGVVNQIDEGEISRYLRPEARLAQGEIASSLGASAMIDVSDGLSLDLYRLAAASGVSADLDRVPLFSGATIEDALGGGEDYELLVTATEGAALKLEAAFAERAMNLFRIGTCVEARSDSGPQVSIRGEPVEVSGWQHNFR